MANCSEAYGSISVTATKRKPIEEVYYLIDLLLGESVASYYTNVEDADVYETDSGFAGSAYFIGCGRHTYLNNIGYMKRWMKEGAHDEKTRKRLESLFGEHFTVYFNYTDCEPGSSYLSQLEVALEFIPGEEEAKLQIVSETAYDWTSQNLYMFDYPGYAEEMEEEEVNE